MSRKPREKSPHDLYHIVFRGTNKQILFESKYDYMRFIEYMQRAKKQIGFELHAYCLMSNHIHMNAFKAFGQVNEHIESRSNDCSNDCSYEHDYHRLTDQEAVDKIKKTMGHKIEFLKDVQKMAIKSRNEYLSEIKKLKISIKQISRLTGIGRNIIQRIK